MHSTARMFPEPYTALIKQYSRAGSDMSIQELGFSDLIAALALLLSSPFTCYALLACAISISGSF
jgi:hypothetical protein